MGVCWLAWIALRGGYSQKIIGAGTDEYHRVFLASLLAIGTVAFVCYLIKFDLSRGFVCLSFLLGVPVLLSARLAARKVLHSLRRTGRMRLRVLALGGNVEVARIVAILSRENSAGYEVVGSWPPPDRLMTAISDASHHETVSIGWHTGLRQFCEELSIDAVLVVGGPMADAESVRRTAWELEGTNVDLIVAPSLTDIAGPRVDVRPVAGLPLLHIDPPQADGATRLAKRSFDLALATLLSLVALPVVLVIAVAIKMDDGGPVIFRQKRVGLRGHEFECLKFRSMCSEAEELRGQLLSLNDSDGPLFKMWRDPRVTRVGKFIRRYSLDELPQLLNVLRGEMSLVGPRPPLRSEVEQYERFVDRRLLVRPGLTGLWQVSGRSSLSWADAVRLDLFYVDNWSMVQDIAILAKTAHAIFKNRETA